MELRSILMKGTWGWAGQGRLAWPAGAAVSGERRREAAQAPSGRQRELGSAGSRVVSGLSGCEEIVKGETRAASPAPGLRQPLKAVSSEATGKALL